MQVAENKNTAAKKSILNSPITNIVLIIIVLFLFLQSINLMGSAFSNLGSGAAESFLQLTSNPFLSLFIGLLITALIQSSSTSTSMIVAAVASGSLTLTNAVPMIIGANIGTTITSTIVSLGYINKASSFKRALAAGTIHDFANIITAIILFPLEYYYGLLSSLSEQVSNWLSASKIAESIIPIELNIFNNSFFVDFVFKLIDSPIIVLAIAFALLFGSIKIISNLIYKLAIGPSKERFNNIVFKKPLNSFLWGTGLTASVQSSSVTTSLIIPLVATSRVKLTHAFPFIIGANLGTTITALFAAIFKSDAAISIALAHLFFNIFLVLIFLPIPFMRKIPVQLARRFGGLTMKNRIIGFIYIIATFFLIPFSLIYINKEGIPVETLVYEISDQQTNETSFKRVIRQENQNKSSATLIVFEGLPSKEESADQPPEEILEVHRKGDVLFFGESFYLLNETDFCWDDDDNRGKYKICIDDVLNDFKLNDQLTFSQVYHYKKDYYDYSISDSVSTHFYISANPDLVLKIEKFDKTSQLIFQEQLVSISQTGNE